MFKVAKLNEISPVANKIFSGNYTFAKEIESPDAIMLRSFSMHEYDIPKSVLAIARAGAGVNNIPIDKCSERGIVVFNTPGANANAVKELVLCDLLLASRKVVDSANWAQSLKGTGDVGKLVEKGKAQFVGGELYGKKLGVIGLGAIGALVANAATDLGMEVLGFDPFISIDAAWGLNRSIRRITDINQIFTESDYITLHVPLTDNTRGLICAESIVKMKQGAAIINCSRAELVTSADIIEAIRSGKLSRYVTDFPTDDLLGIPNIIAIPHLGASTPEAEDNCAIMAAQQLADYLENGNIKNSVNFPEVAMPRSGEARISVMHKNVKSMITKITGAISETNVNIENMMNKSKGDYAYSIFDICNLPDKHLLNAIAKIEGVISVRVIK